jgi:hypothetical protein
MGVARKAGGRTPGFVDSILALVDQFYEGVVQNVTAWQPPAPKRQPTAAPEPSDDSDVITARAPELNEAAPLIPPRVIKVAPETNDRPVTEIDGQ